MTSLSDIRRGFLDYFAKNGHEPVASGPLVPRNDPSLLFTNAGMVQFKNVFTGAEKRPYNRAATSQKCVRAGGKHNDLDNVGYTARHHTFFEMLGNFSFGDYFKEQAIPFAWDLITKEFGLPSERLLVTIYHDDEEAYGLWKKVTGFGDDRIIRIATSDNFWSMGDTGPCGPCSEIFYDHGPEIEGGPPGSPDQDGDRFIEIWNLVFMQFEQFAGGRREPLPRPSIDTGMGLERIGAVLQGKHDNYDTDLLRALIEASAQASGVDPDGPHAVSHRVIADHLRASSFLIADGVTPSNEGRGYVLRRIMRRAMRHAHIIGADAPLMWRLAPALTREMGDAFPELVRAQSLIQETLKLEETRFRETLERGLRLLDDATEAMSAGDRLSGEVAFRLYDTYGFPYDLTEDALRGRGITVDRAGFDAAMAAQKAAARAAWAGSGEAATDAVWFDLRAEHGATEFLGYETETAEGVVVALVRDGAPVAAATAGDAVAIVANQTPFYAESGGQVGDAGVILAPGGLEADVADTQKRAGDLHVMTAQIRHGTLSVGDAVEMRVDHARRSAIRANHSATHLLHAALRRHLGDHVTQKGSLVAPDRLRFDFSHPRALTAEEVSLVEAEVNAVIRDNGGVDTRLMAPEDAIKAGAMALFGEKYGDEVRVLSMGESPSEPGRVYSVELCGGVHVRRTGDIALFKIASESAAASGVRRIEAVTAAGALDWLNARERAARAVAAHLKVAPEDAPARVAALLDERRRLERELAAAKKALALSGGAAAGGGDGASAAAPAAAAALREVAGVKALLRVLDGVSAKDLRGLIDAGKGDIGSGVIGYVAVNDGKAAVAVGVTDDLKGRVDAVALARAGVAALGGKGGGGRPDFAQGGGPDAARANDAVEAMAAAIGAAAA